MMESQIDLDVMFQFLLISVIIGGVVVWVMKLLFNFSEKTLGRLVVIVALVMLLVATVKVGEGSGVGFVSVMLFIAVVFTVVAGVIGWVMSKLTGGRINFMTIILFVVGFLGAKKAMEWEKRKIEKHDADMRRYKDN